jgi:hypothetical protein
MTAQRRNISEEEHSIRERSNELYVDATADGPARSTKPFPVYLRETPAQPLSAGIKAMFWAIGLIVVLLFLAALWRVSHRHVPRARTRQNPPRTAVHSDADLFRAAGRIAT